MAQKPFKVVCGEVWEGLCMATREDLKLCKPKLTVDSDLSQQDQNDDKNAESENEA